MNIIRDHIWVARDYALHISISVLKALDFVCAFAIIVFVGHLNR